MVEFVEKANAVNAKKHLNGTFIYANCCSLRVDYAKPDKLLVSFIWIYTLKGYLPPRRSGISFPLIFFVRDGISFRRGL